MFSCIGLFSYQNDLLEEGLWFSFFSHNHFLQNLALCPLSNYLMLFPIFCVSKSTPLLLSLCLQGLLLPLNFVSRATFDSPFRLLQPHCFFHLSFCKSLFLHGSNVRFVTSLKKKGSFCIFMGFILSPMQ